MDDCISRKAAIDICNDELLHTEDYSPIRTWNRILQLPSAHQCEYWDSESNFCALHRPSAQPEYFDYTDIDEAWEYYAKEHDDNLTDNAKKLKDAMWVGYRIGKKSAQPEVMFYPQVDGITPSVIVQPERKKGKWTEKHHAYSDEESIIEEWQSCRCSECGRYDTRPYMYYFSEPNYCSYCGADMRGDNHETD